MMEQRHSPHPPLPVRQRNTSLPFHRFLLNTPTLFIRIRQRRHRTTPNSLYPLHFPSSSEYGKGTLTPHLTVSFRCIFPFQSGKFMSTVWCIHFHGMTGQPAFSRLSTKGNQKKRIEIWSSRHFFIPLHQITARTSPCKALDL